MTEARVLVISAASRLTADVVVALAGRGYVVTTAAQLDGGLDDADRRRIDALILDAESCAAPRRRDALAQYPAAAGILILPAHANVDELIGSWRDGWSDALVQPLSSETLLGGLAQALRRALQTREQTRATALAPLVRISDAFLLNLDVDALLQDVVRTVQQETKCDRVSLMLVAGRELRICAATGLDPEVVASWRGEVGEGIAGRTAATGEPLLINAGEEDPQVVGHLRDDKIKSAVSLPLRVRGRIVGVLNLSNFIGRDRFYDSDVQFLSLLAGQAAIAIHNAGLYDSLQTSYMNTIISLANALEARDSSAAGHSTKVLEFALRTAAKLGVSEAERKNIRNAAMLHDLGKIGIRDAILLKPGRLDDSEWLVMRAHPQVGSRILDPVRDLAPCVPLVLHHHERWDGRGYPGGLAGEQIPLGARIIAVADAYDAMTSPRIYRDTPGKDFAVAELRRVAGSQLDPDIVAVFLETLEESENEPDPR
jgi:HD-GYP domain-containing protein (c-di-GMP phosphodiesterase class II)